MDYGDVTNNLTKANNYFNKLLYRDILSLRPIVNLKKENNEILLYYYKQRRKKKLAKLIEHMNVRNILYNFKMNFIYHDI